MAEISAAAKANNPRLVLSVESEFDAAAAALTSKLVAYGLTNCSSGRT